MAKPEGDPLPAMPGPANYRIRVRGDVGPHWVHRLGGMQVQKRKTADGGVETVLSGRLADQAALIGVFNTLYELHLPVLSVECLREETNESNDSQ